MSSLTCVAFLPFFFLAALGLETASSRAGASMTFDATAAKNRPVSKVITLLKDMLKQLEKEAEDDEAIYNKLACWCEQNDKEKTQAIKDAEDMIQRLTTRSERLTASSARLGVEITGLNKEEARDVSSLDKATNLRQRQLAEFNMEEHDLIASISALKAALVVLSKHHETSLLQMPSTHMQSIKATMQHAMDKHSVLLQGVLTPTERKVAMSFIQQPDFMDAEPTFKQSYAPQSGEIYGILKQMLETFEASLAQAQKEEGSNQAAYSQLAKAKKGEIRVEHDQADDKTGVRADKDEDNAETHVDIDDVKRALAADQEFLLMLKEKCQMTDKEWEERQRARQLEMEAVSKALAVLSGDDAHDLFTRTFNPSLLQESSNTQSAVRDKAASLLTAVAKKFGKPQLVTLAYKVRLDAFTRVKAAIDDMVAQLSKESEDEIKHKDFCVDEFSKNQLETEAKQRDLEDLNAKIEDLKMTASDLTKAIADLQSQIKEMQVQMKRAGEDREKENLEFQAVVADQRQTQQLLKAALGVLQDFYGKGTGLLEQPKMPAGFEPYKKNAGSSSVMSLLQQIIQDAKSMESEAIRSEEDAQKAYEMFVKDTNGSIDAKSKEIVNKSEAKASTEEELVTAKEGKSSTLLELEQLSNSNAELHASCDFVLKNFEVRQTARSEEIEALKQAKAILSGAKFDSFLQGH